VTGPGLGAGQSAFAFEEATEPDSLSKLLPYRRAWGYKLHGHGILRLQLCSTLYNAGKIPIVYFRNAE
jgi:hypothetical protein